MIAKNMLDLVKNSSAIRAMFEEGKKLKKSYGEDKVFDFSLGNPNVEAPGQVQDAISDIVKEYKPNFLHGYMNNSGYECVRKKIADHINKRENTSFSAENIVMTVGAAGGLNVILKTLLDPEDEVIVFRPYFGEYRSYVSNMGGKLVEVSYKEDTFYPDLEDLESKLSQKTKVVIINTPNNPTGVIYSEDFIVALAKVLEEKEKAYGSHIYLISDEPYRELVYDGFSVPYLTKYYKNTIVAYSYSKSLSLPGERIGYLLIPDEADCSVDIQAAVNVATRILGFVNAPSLMQLVVAKCLDAKADIAFYERNRNKIYEGLTALGFTCIKPQGAFYLFIKAPVADDKEFCQLAKKHNILMVAGSSFASPGYVRLAYCTSYETICNSLPAFAKLAEECGVGK